MSPTKPKGLRNGWTTGTCAAAAAKAAAIGLVTGTVPDEVDVALPGGRRVGFGVDVPPGGRRDGATAVVVKDAGDDPDCTNGAHVTAEVAWTGSDRSGSDDPAAGSVERSGAGSALAGVESSLLVAGEGVGTVTMPGLGLPVGQPAINPVPRRMILASLAEVTPERLRVTLSVPGGATMAIKTTNARLGIVGGISILGTTGIVRPFSTAAFRASVAQQVDVACASGERHLVLATGSRTEAAAMRMLPHLAEVCFVEVGDYTGVALGRAAAAGARMVTMVAMAGKIAKLAAGVMMTHFHRSKVDNEILASAAAAAGAGPDIVAAATATSTARHFVEACMAERDTAPLAELCRMAASACRERLGGKVGFEMWMVDFEGADVLARS